VSTRLRVAVARVLQRLPRAAWTCALVAVVSAACWSLVTPPFQAPDEPSHFAYVQYLVQARALPSSSVAAFSPEEDAVLKDLSVARVRWHPELSAAPSPAARARLHRDMSGGLSRRGPGGAGVATSEPPLYYALAAVPYELASGGTLLDQLELMRLLSALMAGVTALFSFLFVREALPGVRWAWTVGGLAAALTPVLGFTSGLVTPDAMLCAVSAAIFYCLARGFRRGLTRRLAIATGCLIAVGFVTKVNFIGLAPGIALGLVVLGVRRSRDAGSQRPALDSMAVAMAIAASPVCIYVLYNLAAGKRALGIVSSAIDLTAGHESLISDISYTWQFYLPRLPGMTSFFPGLSTTRELWFDRTVGLYGWLDTGFPPWLENLALIPAVLLAVLCARALFARRSALSSRLPELLVYVVMSVGMMTLLGQDSHLHRTTEGAGYIQPRYMLALLPLAAAASALAARGAGRRWGPAVGTLIVILVLAQDLFSQLQTVARFYG
jgi:4-amino-4-deoxy-L-arabinose transferase-like glycosyltransferase